MAENLTDINGVAVVELGYRKSGSTEIEQLTGQFAIVEEARISEQINAPAVWDMIVTSKNSGYVDDLLRTVMISGDPVVFVRLGVVASDNRFYLPWQTHTIQSVAPRPYQDGHAIGLKTVDLLQQIHRSSATRSHRGSISTIVARIFERWGAKTLVEPTQDKESSYIQSNQSDIDFVVHRLLPRSLNERGRGNYRLYVQDDVVHFHTLDYQASVHRMTYFGPNTAVDLKFMDESQSRVLTGAGGVTGLVHDPYTGESRVVRENTSLTVNHAKVTPKLSSIPGSGVPLPLHLGQNRLQEAQAIVQNTYETSYQSIFKAELVMARVPHVRLNDLIDLVVQPTQGNSSPWSGPYSVTGLVHAMVKGALTSNFTLARGEMSTIGANSKLLESLKIKVSENFATGQPINLPVVRSSRSTRSSGEKITGGATVKPVTTL